MSKLNMKSKFPLWPSEAILGVFVLDLPFDKNGSIIHQHFMAITLQISNIIDYTDLISQAL